MAQPEISILVSSFERPGHVRRVLASIAAQRGVRGAIEVIVTDDGSRDHTQHLVREFAASVRFPVRFTTHPHAGFHIARCRNEGVAAANAPYLLFLDGDCLMPPGHLRAHLDRRRDGYAMAGYPIYLSEQESERISAAEVARGQITKPPWSWPRIEMRWRHIRGVVHALLGDPQRPKLLGGNLGIARADYERVNGYDENFVGWGCEDDDLRLRLRAAGVTVASIAWWTNTYHLWHPKTPTAPTTWRAGANVEYFRRPLRLRRCLAGLTKRRLQDLDIRGAGEQPIPKQLATRLPTWCRVAMQGGQRLEGPAELEIAVASTAASFSRGADCRVLVVLPGQIAPRRLVRDAQLIFSDQPIAGTAPDRLRSLAQLDGALAEQLGAAPVSVAARRAA